MKNIIFAFLFLCLFQSVSGQSITGYEYWFDSQGDKREQAASSGGNISIAPDVSGLSEGVHAFYFRAKDSKGQWSSPITRYFFRSELSDAANRIGAYEYWIDSDYSGRKKTESDEGAISLNLGLNGLSYGVHTFNFRARDTDNKWSVPITKYFYFFPGAGEDGNRIVSYEYWFDNEEQKRIVRTVEKTARITVAENIDVSGMKSGIHVLHFAATDESGRRSTVTSDRVETFGSGKTDGAEGAEAALQVYVHSNTLYIKSSASETVEIYTAGGALLYRGAKEAAGLMTVGLNGTGNNILIVRGSSGWSRKFVYATDK